MFNFEVEIPDNSTPEEAENIILNLKVGQYVVLETGYSQVTKTPTSWLFSIYNMSSVEIKEEDYINLVINHRV